MFTSVYILCVLLELYFTVLEFCPPVQLAKWVISKTTRISIIKLIVVKAGTCMAVAIDMHGAIVLIQQPKQLHQVSLFALAVHMALALSGSCCRISHSIGASVHVNVRCLSKHHYKL